MTQTEGRVDEREDLRSDRHWRSAEDRDVIGFDIGAVGAYVLSRRTPTGGYCFYRTPAWGVEEPNAPDTFAALESLRLLGLEVPEPDLTRTWLRSLQDDQGGFTTLTVGWAALRGARTPPRWPTSIPAPLDRAQRPDHR